MMSSIFLIPGKIKIPISFIESFFLMLRLIIVHCIIKYFGFVFPAG